MWAGSQRPHSCTLFLFVINNGGRRFEINLMNAVRKVSLIHQVLQLVIV